MTLLDHYYSGFLNAYQYPRQLHSYHISMTQDAVIYHKGKKLVDFSSNDYLGLARHDLLITLSYKYLQQWGVGASSSRLVRGNLAIFDQIESRLASALGKETALILGTGYLANATILEALLDRTIFNKEPLIFCDKACHASIYAGISYSKNIYRFRHNDLEHLRVLLKKNATTTQPIFIIAESIYSMDGDQVDIESLTKLAQEFKAVLYIDDAHGVGVYGESGWGKAARLTPGVDIIFGTFSKALGSFGSYIGCSHALKKYLVHRCKGLIYSTALPPPILGAIDGAIRLLPHLDKERQRVNSHAEKLRHFLKEEGLSYGQSTTQIVPWIIGDAEKTRLIAHELESLGILATAIQAPTVPRGKNRIRFCISALHKDMDFELLFEGIRQVKKFL